jgi:hypothetical protein
MGIQAKSEEQAFGAGGSLRMPLARVSSIAIGAARQEEVRVCISDDLEAIGAAIKTKVGGLIGFDFMMNFRVTIDYQQSVLHFALSAENDDRNGRSAVKVPFTLTPAEPLMLVQVSVNNGGPFQFILDTAASRTVVTPGLIDDLKIDVDPGIAGAGMGGKLETRRATLKFLSVGSTTVRDIRVVVGTFLDAISAAIGAKVDGIIGNDFLRQFRVTMDCPGHLLVLEQPVPPPR